MQIQWEGFGRALRNPVRVDMTSPALIRAIPL